MGFILEVIFETIIDGIFKLWTDFIKKRNPDYDKSHSKKILTIIIGILLILAITIAIFGILFLIEWVFPNLFDVVGFD